MESFSFQGVLYSDKSRQEIEQLLLQALRDAEIDHDPLTVEVERI